jgi:N-acetyl-alpha-D-muramate 1-phosphate uridylyltransferase
MIFAAGLGTRLRPLTNDRPKALVEVNGITMLEIAIRKLKNAGVDQLIINLNHYADKIRAFVKTKNSFDIDILFSDETELLLDTGGGLKKAGWFLKNNDPFFVYNVDILTDLDLKKMVAFHESNRPLATLAIRKRAGSRFFLFDDHMKLCGWKNYATQEEKIATGSTKDLLPFAFSGIHLIDPSFFALIDEKGVFSIVDVYLRLASRYLIKGYFQDEGLWMDLGKPDNVLAGEAVIGEFGLDRFIG